MLLKIYSVTVNSGGQSCIDNPNALQQGNATLQSSRQVIVPGAVFYCNGRITSIRASFDRVSSGDNLPIIQIWHPLSPNSSVYNRTGQVKVTNTTLIGTHHYFTNITISEILEFQSGDVIGYYQPSNLQLAIWNSNHTNGYTSYSTSDSNNSISVINIHDESVVEHPQRQPLIEVLFGKNFYLVSLIFYHSVYVIQCAGIRCDELSTASNGEIRSCSSGSVGVGYEGDTCSFTCNTGYELTGSDTRTCQSDGSWSGNDDVCRRGMILFTQLCQKN